MQISLLKSNRLIKTYDTIRTSFWFVPCVIIVITLALCTMLIWLDTRVHLHDIPWLKFLYHANGDITRNLLTTIAGSVMTVVSITFSITMVALTNASSQFGPRLLRNFMNDSSTQTVLGTFIAIFLYCLALTRATDNFAQGEYLPGLAIAGASLLTLLSIFLLIYFIHHVATNLQADNIIDKVYRSLEANIESIFAEHKENESTEKYHAEVKEKVDAIKGCIKSQGSGYVQAINYASLTELMSQDNSYMKLLIAPGDFVTKGSVIIEHSDNALTDQQQEELLYYIILGAKRTPIQDPEFAILQLVEIALRALSPSINDPYSGIACIDKLSATLCNLTQRQFPSGITCDADGTPRLLFKTARFGALGDTAYDQIRQNARNNLAVQLRLIEGLIRIAEQASNKEHWDFIVQQKTLLEHDMEQQSLIGNDQSEASQRLNKLNNLIACSNYE